MTNPQDDLEAVRQLIVALEPFKNEERDRIIRWAREKLGMQSVSNQGNLVVPTAPFANIDSPATGSSQTHRRKDLKQFVLEKNPKSDIQFAATVAYYYKFEVAEDRRKDEISAADLLEACRLATRKRPPRPDGTLHNGVQLGLLDKGTNRGTFRINSVGENLVAMALPEKQSVGTVRHSRKSRKMKKIQSKRKK